MESPASTQSAVTRCGRCASYAAITLERLTCSFPNAVGQSAPSASIASSSVSGRPPRCHSPSTRTCFATPVGSSSRTMATTRAPCSTTSGTRTSSTRSGTPKWRPTGSRTFGGTDDGRAGSIVPHGRSSKEDDAPYRRDHSLARWRSHLARNALPRADCRVGLQHQPVLGLGSVRRGGFWFYRPLDHSNRAAGLRFQRCLQVLDHGLKLLVRQALDHIAVLDFHLARH